MVFRIFSRKSHSIMMAEKYHWCYGNIRACVSMPGGALRIPRDNVWKDTLFSICIWTAKDIHLSGPWSDLNQVSFRRFVSPDMLMLLTLEL